MYITKQLHDGYNPYLTLGQDDQGTMMDVGLLILLPGESYVIDEPEKETAALLLEGKVEFEFDGKRVVGLRRDCFRDEGFCLHVCRATKSSIKAIDRAEIYIQKTVNPRAFVNRVYQPSDVMVQHAGDKGELMGCMRREIKTFFDYESAPWSNMVLGEVLNFPGKWSSYPPHHHPQPEVYFYRFDRPMGFGAGFANGEIYKTGHNGLSVINSGFHSQTAAPGYAMCYMWGIRHLDNDPWKKTRIDDPEHEWLWKPDANQHIFKMEV